MTDKSMEFVDFETFLFDRLPRVVAIGVIAGAVAILAAMIVMNTVPPRAHAIFGVFAGIVTAYILDPVFDRIKTW